MIVPTIPDAVKEIALARLLAVTPFVGYIGDFDGEFSGATLVADVGRAMEGSAIIFVASSLFVQTFQGRTRKASARWIDHEIINGAPVSEFVGRSLKDVEFEILLHSKMCFDPLSAYQKLEKACESGRPQLVFLDGKSYGKWTIRSIEGEETHWAYGRPAVMVVTMSMREYRSSIPTVAEQKLREDELRRGDTGKGGPDRLPGTGKSNAGLVPESASGWVSGK
jgi:phage protein U